MRIVDPTLPRDGTDLMPQCWVMRIVDPTLPRDGTDLMPQCWVMRIDTRRYRVTVLTS
jgi:hypothetical protein